MEDHEAAAHLALALEGPVAQIRLDLAPVDWTSFKALIPSLERHFGQRLSAEGSKEHLASCQSTRNTATPGTPCMPFCIRCLPNACGSM